VLWLYEVEGTVFKTWVRLPPGPPVSILCCTYPFVVNRLREQYVECSNYIRITFNINY